MKSAENVREQLKRTMERLNLQSSQLFNRRASSSCLYRNDARQMLSTDFRDKDLSALFTSPTVV